MVGHDYESDAPTSGFLQQRVQHSQYDPLGVIVVQQPATTVDRERHEVSVQSVIHNSAFRGHRVILIHALWDRNRFEGNG